MKKTLLFIIIVLVSCQQNKSSTASLGESVPTNIPIAFKPEIVPEGMLIHSGVFSPDLREYYYTLSDQNFETFTVKMIRKENEKWSEPVNAFFNSDYNEHGMNFSPDGNSLYFSSTRPTNIDGIPDTWHIWQSHKIGDKWSEAEFVDIPNLRQKLVSHPSITNDGTIFFHSGNVDYGNLELFFSKRTDGKFQNAIKLPPEINFEANLCTPHISPDKSYILFEGSSILYISFKNEYGKWQEALPLNKNVNREGRGNPYITPDEKYLFFAAGVESNPNEKWSIYWVNTEYIFSDI